MQRTWVKALVFSTAFILFFILFVRLTLPIDTIRDITRHKLEAALGHKYDVEFEHFDLSGMTAVEVDGMTITSKRPPADLSEEEKKKLTRVSVTVDHFEADLLFFKTLLGTPTIDFEADLLGGKIQGRIAQISYEPIPDSKPKRRLRRKTSKNNDNDNPETDTQDASQKLKGTQVSATINDVALQQLRSLKSMLGLPLTGTIQGELENLLFDGRGRLIDGKIGLNVERIAYGPGQLPEWGMGFEFKQALRLGTLNSQIDIKSSEAIVKLFKTTGPDLIVEANGSITLSRSAPNLRLNARFKPGQEFLKANNLQSILQPGPLNPLGDKLKRAKAGDWYGATISGRPSNPKFFPKARTASSLDKISPK